MDRKKFDDDDDDVIYTIKDVERFKQDIKRRVWENFSEKLESKMITDDDDLESYLTSDEEFSDELPDEIMDYEINKFIIFDDFDENCGCIIKRDIFRLINRLTNEIIGSHLNQLVEKGYLQMCWDEKYHEFIWRPTDKE